MLIRKNCYQEIVPSINYKKWKIKILSLKKYYHPENTTIIIYQDTKVSKTYAYRAVSFKSKATRLSASNYLEWILFNKHRSYDYPKKHLPTCYT